jgi:hypothetical protein
VPTAPPAPKLLRTFSFWIFTALPPAISPSLPLIPMPITGLFHPQHHHRSREQYSHRQYQYPYLRNTHFNVPHRFGLAEEHHGCITALSLRPCPTHISAHAHAPADLKRRRPRRPGSHQPEPHGSSAESRRSARYRAFGRRGCLPHRLCQAELHEPSDKHRERKL